MLNEERLNAIVPQGAIGHQVEFHPTIGSTNDRASELAKAGAPHGTLVVADQQSAGRGLGSRRWWTARGAGLALSVVLRPRVKAASGLLSGLGAVSVCEAIEELAGEPEIKWPNDVLLGGKKVAGILAEGAWLDGELEYAVLGIGVNVHPSSAPSNADFPATSLDDEMGQHADRSSLLASILRSLDGWNERLSRGELLSAWERRLAYRDQIVSYGANVQGVIVRLGSEGELVLRAEGQEVILRESENHLRLVDRDKE